MRADAPPRLTLPALSARCTSAPPRMRRARSRRRGTAPNPPRVHHARRSARPAGAQRVSMPLGRHSRPAPHHCRCRAAPGLPWNTCSACPRRHSHMIAAEPSLSELYTRRGRRRCRDGAAAFTRTALLFASSTRRLPFWMRALLPRGGCRGAGQRAAAAAEQARPGWWRWRPLGFDIVASTLCVLRNRRTAAE